MHLEFWAPRTMASLHSQPASWKPTGPNSDYRGLQAETRAICNFPLQSLYAPFWQETGVEFACIPQLIRTFSQRAFPWPCQYFYIGGLGCCTVSTIPQATWCVALSTTQRRRSTFGTPGATASRRRVREVGLHNCPGTVSTECIRSAGAGPGQSLHQSMTVQTPPTLPRSLGCSRSSSL